MWPWGRTSFSKPITIGVPLATLAIPVLDITGEVELSPMEECSHGSAVLQLGATHVMFCSTPWEHTNCPVAV